MIDNIKKFLNEDQDPKAIEKVMGTLNDVLMSSEEVTYIAVQKKPAVNISPDCVALTNKRIIFCRYRNLGLSVDFQEFILKDVKECELKESMLGSEFTLKSNSSQSEKIDYLPKSQARRLYTLVQEQIEQQREILRQRDLEEKRAGAISVNVPANDQKPAVPPAFDPTASLQKLKSLFENDLISQEEYDTKKAEILARM